MFRNRPQFDNPILDEDGQPILDENGFYIYEEDGQEYTNRKNVRARVGYDVSIPYDYPLAYDKAYTNLNN